jgi:competence protein ComEC
LLAQNILATGYVQGAAELLATEWTWASVRAGLSARIGELSEGNDFSRFWTTLLIADSSAVTPTDWQTLQATGTIHLVAISGSHIALVSVWAFALGALFARLGGLIWPAIAGRLSHWLPPLMASAVALVYAGLADFSIPTLRAFFACLVLNLCWLIGLRIKPLTVLGVGMALVAINEPLAWQNNGFWLSFAAVLLLIHILAGRPGRSPLRAAAWLQLVLSVGLAAPLLWLGLGVSWLSPFANLLAEPTITLVVVPALFLILAVSLVSVPLAQFSLALIDQLFTQLWRYLQWLEALPQLATWAPQPLVWAPKPLAAPILVLAFIGVLLVLAPRGLHLRGMGVLIIALSLLVQPPTPPDLQLTVMDVGQGLSVVARTPSNTWVYDTGPGYDEFADAGNRIVAPYLHREGVKAISLMVSHADLDHSGGAASLLAQFDTQALLVGEPLKLDSDTAHLPLQQRCEQGQQWQFGGVNAQVLWPPVGSSAKGNRASCVVLLVLTRASDLDATPIRILLTGDIDREVEQQLLPYLAAPVDLLVAPHHGSKSSSGQDFINTLHPRYVVFSTGFNNRFNHPHPSVEARYRAAGATTFNTASSGAVTFAWGAKEAVISETRIAAPKLWYP